MSTFAFLLCLTVAFEDVSVAITTTESEEIRGTVDLDTLRITTSFGAAEIRADQFDTIELGETDTILTKDGTDLRGTVALEFLTIRHEGGEITLLRDAVRSIRAHQPLRVRRAQIVDGVAANGLTYHVRVPRTFRKDTPMAAILILHGSNMNTKDYIGSMNTAWPEVAARHILIGINGEKANQVGPGARPTFNYTYVNFVGKSKYEGFPGTDRESPALVAEAVEEIRGLLPINRLFVGGHSQGGFLTYSLYMNYPELFDGAFPAAAGLIFQCEPNAYEDEALIELQRQRPLAIVHGSNDTVVSFDTARYAYDAFEDADYPALKLITDDTAGHRFMFMPIDTAIGWLERLSSDDPQVLIALARESLDSGDTRTAWVALQRAETLGADVEALARELETTATAAARVVQKAMDDHPDGTWVDAYLDFRSRFGSTAAATDLNARYDEQRTRQQERADTLFGEARTAFQQRDQDGGYAKYQLIVQECYASSWYRLAKRALGGRKSDNW